MRRDRVGTPVHYQQTVGLSWSGNAVLLRRRSLPPQQCHAANHGGPFRHISDHQPITSLPPATSVIVNQSRQSIRPCSAGAAAAGEVAAEG
jgi:hypothetical protein